MKMVILKSTLYNKRSPEGIYKELFKGILCINMQ